MTELELPEGWTIVHEQRRVAHEDRASAFTDGMQWSVRDPAGQRPPQAEWPTPWRDAALLYARALDARRRAEDAGELAPPWSQGPVGGSLLAVKRADLVDPADWTGPPHLRPGLYRRKDGA
jgi:hypothetical protein